MPGSTPEHEVLAPVTAAPHVRANRVGVTTDAVQNALAQIRFHEHQGWFALLGRSLGMQETAIQDHMVSVWASDWPRRAKTKRLAAKIREALGL